MRGGETGSFCTVGCNACTDLSEGTFFKYAEGEILGRQRCKGSPTHVVCPTGRPDQHQRPWSPLVSPKTPLASPIWPTMRGEPLLKHARSNETQLTTGFTICLFRCEPLPGTVPLTSAIHSVLQGGRFYLFKPRPLTAHRPSVSPLTQRNVTTQHLQ